MVQFRVDLRSSRCMRWHQSYPTRPRLSSDPRRQDVADSRRVDARSLSRKVEISRTDNSVTSILQDQYAISSDR